MQHVVSQLITKKEELTGELNYHKGKMRQLEDIISGLNTSIKVFDPKFDLKSIKPIRYSPNKQYFKRGESHTLVLDALRNEGKAISTNNITIAVMKKKGLDYEDKDLVTAVSKSLQSNLNTQVKNKLIKKTNDGMFNYWEIVA